MAQVVLGGIGGAVGGGDGSLLASLALVTLVPLPIIGWLIHVVRDRLREAGEIAEAGERPTVLVPAPASAAIC